VQERKRRGRPPLNPGEAKRASFNTRLRPSLKERLEAEARESGRSLSEQIEFRLERACRDDDALDALFDAMVGGARNAGVLLYLGRIFRDASSIAGFNQNADWLDDSGEFEAVRLAVDKALLKLRPHHPGDPDDQRANHYAFAAAVGARDPRISAKLGDVANRLAAEPQP
jgi:hypothetical protein